ncbi:MAG: S49 family peptidase, partial [Gammaproteobacteria bacterium]|nr:S49 family peptidase [Gammaproteobacteria bacterium]
FSPVNPSQVAHVETMLNNIHTQFIEAVRKGRGERLKDEPGLFSGLFWSGEQALEIGLVDELASERTIARDIVKAEELVNFTPKENLLDRLAGRIGAGAASALETVLRQQPSLQ